MTLREGVSRYGGELFGSTVFGFVMGVGVGSFTESRMIAWLILTLAAAIAGVNYRSALGWRSIVFLICMAGGVVHVQTVFDAWQRQVVAEYSVEGKATVMSAPEMSGRFQKVTLEFTECHSQCPEQKVLGFFSPYTALRTGEVIYVTCDLKLPSDNIGEDHFNYKMFLAKDGIASLCYPKKWEHREDPKASLFSGLATVRLKLEEHVSSLVPDPEGALAKGLLFGGDNRLSDAWQEKFSWTGTVHIVAVSGANVVIVAQGLLGFLLLLGLWRRQAFWFVLLGIAAFVIMVGAPASAVRAGVMGSLAFVALQSGRMTSGTRLWALAGAVMLWVNPLLLRYDIGFQLSFAATLGILLLMPLCEEWLGKGRVQSELLRELLFMTLAAEAFVMPLVAYHFHMFSPLSLIANALITLVVPWAMLFSFVAAVTALVWPWLGTLVSVLAYLCLYWIIVCVDVIGSKQWSVLEVKEISVWVVIIWYMTLFVCLWRLRKRFKIIENTALQEGGFSYRAK